MTRPEKISTEDYNYILPDDKIAGYPLKDRDSSKLLIYKDKLLSDDVFFNLPELLPSNSLLVFNNSKVINARLEFYKTTGARIEIFCLEPYEPSDYQLSLSTNYISIWKCFVGNAKKWKQEDLYKDISFGDTVFRLKARRVQDLEDSVLVEFSWDNSNVCLAEIFDIYGNVPIPPYLNRKAEEIDKSRYQTVYGENKGSVAAPTAGLHFTEKLLKRISQKDIQTDFITLHVGAGTFQPVKSENAVNHSMHTEFFTFGTGLVENLIKYYRNISVVGTTSVRSIESIYCIGKQLQTNSAINENRFFINQWEAYNYNADDDGIEILENLLKWMKAKHFERLECHTQIMIVPGFRFRYTNRLITNFHQPKSTLLMLIAAYAGHDWMNIYNHALSQNYRFLSYGDSMLING